MKKGGFIKAKRDRGDGKLNADREKDQEAERQGE